MALFNIELLEYALRPNCMQYTTIEYFSVRTRVN
jgi:hypothetical protein